MTVFHRASRSGSKFLSGPTHVRGVRGWRWNEGCPVLLLPFYPLMTFAQLLYSYQITLSSWRARMDAVELNKLGCIRQVSPVMLSGVCIGQTRLTHAYIVPWVEEGHNFTKGECSICCRIAQSMENTVAVSIVFPGWGWCNRCNSLFLTSRLHI